jgi:hypothetical protein
VLGETSDLEVVFFRTFSAVYVKTQRKITKSDEKSSVNVILKNG